MKELLKTKYIFLFVILALVIRLIIALLPGFKIDVDAWFAWSIRLYEIGAANFYSPEVWTNYTPGFLYILYFLGFLRDIFNVGNETFYYLLKLPSIFAEVILGLVVYKISLKYTSNKFATIAASFVWFNPALIFNSSVWGQIDGLLSLFMVLNVYFLTKNKLILSSILLGLSFLIKPQTIALAPVYIFYLFNNLSVKKLIQLALPGLLTIFLLSMPFFTQKPFTGIIELTKNMIGDYSYTSLFSYNFWGVYGFWISDTQPVFANITLQLWGYLILIVFWVSILYLYFKKKISLYALAAFTTLSFYFLPTRVHERYLYPAIPFLILSAAQLKSKSIILLTGILSLVHIFNLYYVYVYYNELYLKLPPKLFNDLIYNFLDSQGKLVSFLGSLLFLSLTFVIISNSHDRKNTKA